MNQEEYIKTRVINQMEWYDKKSIKYQKRYKQIRTFEIVFAASIPLLSVIPGDIGAIKFIIALLGALITVIAGINAMNKYHELWVSYRSTAEILKQHKFLFETKSTPYNNENSFKLLVKNTEGILSNEQGTWIKMFNKSDNDPGTDDN